MRKESRNAARETGGTKVWIRFDDGFSVRACRMIDLSSTGVRIVVDAPHDVADRFSLLLSRGAFPAGAAASNGGRARRSARSSSVLGATSRAGGPTR